jgi:hypothetical protein
LKALRAHLVVTVIKLSGSDGRFRGRVGAAHGKECSVGPPACQEWK